MTYNNIEIIITPEVKRQMPASAEEEFVRSLSSLVAAGFIVENDNKEVIVDFHLLNAIAVGSEIIREYTLKYGVDNVGFVSYTNWSNAQ